MAHLWVDALATVAQTRDSLALFISVADNNGEPVAGLNHEDFTVDTLSGTVDFSSAAIRFLAPKAGFYILLVPITPSLENQGAYVVSIVVKHELPVGGTDNGQTIATGYF